MSNANVKRPVEQSAEETTDHLREAAKAAASGFKQAASDLREATQVAGAELSEAGAAVARGAKDLWSQTGDAIRKNPVAAAGIAFAAGVLLTKLLRR